MINEEAIKDAFDRAKKDIRTLETEIKQIKAILEEIKGEFTDLKNQLKSKDLEPEIPFKKISSIGNNGVQSTIINNNHQSSINDNQLPIINNMKKELENTFRTLTDREFSIFMVIYSIDKEGREATYEDIAKQLNVSEHNIRGYLGSLLRKNVPIQKTRYLNSKVSLSIKNEFKQLDLYQKLLKLRLPNSSQKTLFDL